jgi:F-type H+-transporting ATPase subunit delta
MLSSDAREQVLAIVRKNVGGEVQLKEVVNPDLIGGFMLRIGDQQIDTSILTQVRKMRKEFGKNLYVKEF